MEAVLHKPQTESEAKRGGGAMRNPYDAPTLGNSANLKISEETMRAVQQPLTLKRRKELKREKILAYIKSRPYGTRILDAEFMEVGGFKTNSAAWQFINTMVKNGLVIKEPITPRTYSYRVPEEEPRITKVARPKGLSVLDVEEKAMRFSWEHPEHYNDLHEFINWIKQKKD